MQKKLIAFITLFALITGMFVPVSASDAALTEDFKVGFSRVDINPYIDPTLTGDALVAKSNIMQLPLRGVGDVWNRLAYGGLVDDNGDGKVDREDGLAVTCIAVTDGKGNTVMFMTVDLIGGNLADKIRVTICDRVAAAQAAGELKDVVISPDRIHYAGTHTHNAPDVTVYNAKGKTGTNNDGVELSGINTQLGIWIDRTVSLAADAAINALRDRAPAKVSKDYISAAAADSEPVKGRVMNSVRHYVAEDKGCVAGDNFNNRGSDPKQVTPVNDNMYLLKFDFPDSDKLPVILTNWRGHPSMNNTNDEAKSNKNAISSDYPNAFRYTLEYNCTVNRNGTVVNPGEQVYRVAFFNGEGGNVNPRAREKTNGVPNYQWFEDLADALKESRGNVYGRILAAMAQECLSTEENCQVVSTGEIRNTQYTYNCVRRDTNITALAYEAALEYKRQAETKTMSHPFRYTSASGEVFVIGSKFHASNITSYWETRFQAPKNDLVSMELNAIMLGPDVAFVTVPGEPFDYYYNEDGSNAWLNLISEQYGKPFVLGYCNAAKGYIPNSKAYDYNLGSTKWMRGSYESNITPFPQGAGEHMIELFGVMLDGLASGASTDREAYCQHCKSTVNWEAYNGSETLYDGHYYLLEDTVAPQIHIGEGQTVCFDLNGKTVKGETRAFYTKSKGGSTLNLMDTTPGQSGKALGCGGPIGAGAGFGGGGIIIDSGNTLNFYSGSIGLYQKNYYSVQRGGVMRCSGTVNMYGGTILGGVASSFRGDYVNSGGAVTVTEKTALGATVNNSGIFNISGGRIMAGTLETVTGMSTLQPNGSYSYSEVRTPAAGKSMCVHNTGTFKISGNAVVDDLCIDDTTGKKFVVDNKAAPFTGTVRVSFHKPLGESMQFAVTTGKTQLTEGTVVLADGIALRQSGTGLSAVAQAALYADGDFRYYDGLANAYIGYLGTTATDGEIRLLTDTADDLYITKSVCLDLNGYYVTGEVAVAEGATLYGKDSRTDDYTVEDEMSYGKLKNVVCEGGTVSGWTSDGVSYLKITEADGISFHKVDLRIKSMSLRPDCVGVYYSCDFSGDEVVAEHVKGFGIALGVETESGENTLLCDYSRNSQFLPGAGSNAAYGHGTLLNGIMKTGNTEKTNLDHAQLPVYGRAYLQTEEGVLFGAGVTRSLQEQMIAIDAAWGKLTQTQQQAVLQMYKTYLPVMAGWELPNIAQASAQ